MPLHSSLGDRASLHLRKNKNENTWIPQPVLLFQVGKQAQNLLFRSQIKGARLAGTIGGQIAVEVVKL